MSDASPERIAARHFDPHWWIAVFVGIQFLSSGLLFLPGTQALRPIIRALPYLSSLGMFAVCSRLPAPPRPFPAATFLVLSLGLLFLELAHPTTHAMTGLAQLGLQLCIAAPAFWADRLVRGTPTFRFLILCVLWANGVSAVLGVLQVYYPERFMPPEFSALGLAANPELLEAMSYQGAGGQRIIRPPGLSDLPGGAAASGTIAGFLGIALAVQPGWRARQRLLFLVVAGFGVLVVYLTQVRSLLMMMVAALAVLGVLLSWRGRVGQAVRIGALGGGLVVGAFVWAVAIGGTAVAERFLDIVDQGPLESYRENRGHFVRYTFDEILMQYPLGAGVGRWGMMTVYFGKYNDPDFRALHAEIQPTGWLYDGGVPLLLLYAAAIGWSLFHCYQLTTRADLADPAALVFALGTLFVGQSFAGPVFNTTLGIQFWLLMAGLHGAAWPPRPRSSSDVPSLRTKPARLQGAALD